MRFLFVASHIALQHAHFISVVGDLGFRLHLADARPIAVGRRRYLHMMAQQLSRPVNATPAGPELPRDHLRYRNVRSMVTTYLPAASALGDS